jgi:hypothetical protein
VEGFSEKEIYKKWIPYANNRLKCVDTIDEVSEDNFIIITGGGYPNLLEVIDDAIETIDLYDGLFDKLLISVDSEEFTREEKFFEMKNHVENKNCSIPIDIIVQHFCIETWLLGNKKIGPRNPSSVKLKNYKNIFDVLCYDPELLPENEEEELNRAQFAFSYIKALLNEKFRNLSYTKKNPTPVLHHTFFNEVKSRFLNDGHINSFKEFLDSVI